MQKRKIIAVVLVMAVAVGAIFGYEFFVADSLSGYTKVSLTYAQTYSIKFGSTVYYITYNDVQNGFVATMPIFQVTAQTPLSQGRFSEALEQNEKARELNPASYSIVADRGWMLFNSGKKDEGIALLKEVERSAPGFLSPHSYLMTINLELRHYPSYLKEGKKTAEVENDPVLKNIIESARAGYLRDGEHGLLNNLYARQEESTKGKLLGTTLAETCVRMGKRQEALRLLEEAYNRHESNVHSCVSQADLLPLSDEPRYKALVEEIDFSQRSQMAQPATFTAEDQLSFLAASDER